MTGENGKLRFSDPTADIYSHEPACPNLEKLYEQACAELTLQQTKRDHIIHIYTLIFSFIVPLLSSLEQLSADMKGCIVLALTIVGLILAIIVVRYRVYKEVYWLTCISITQLKNLKKEALTKDNIQSVFYHCMVKKWSKNIVSLDDKHKAFDHWRIFKGNIFSAETLYYIIISLLTSILFCVAIYLIVKPLTITYIILIGVAFLLMFGLLLHIYFRNLENVYKALVDGQSNSFNFAFGKAWFLHFYRDGVM